MPVTELYITQVRGKVNGLDREEIIKNCGQDLHIASDASAEAKTVFDRDTIRITMQYIGTHLAYQKQTASGDVHMTAVVFMMLQQMEVEPLHHLRLTTSLRQGIRM